MNNKKYSTNDFDIDILLGPRAKLNSHWVGNTKVKPTIPILVMAGHADSQGASGAGTAGEAVAQKGFSSMNPLMSDELFWNLKIKDAVVKLGQERGLNIISYDPKIRNITNENNQITNWSVGSIHALSGGYSLEIHFDSYGKYGIGSGLIPAITSNLNLIDESLAQAFGRFPLYFRGGLGAPRRQIRVLEIGKLEGDLEQHLRDPDTRQLTIDGIAKKVINSIERGIRPKNSINQKHHILDISLPKIYQ